MSNGSIWPIHRTLSSSTTLGQSGLGSNGNEGVLHIPQSSIISGASASDSLVSCPGHSFAGRVTPQQRFNRYILQPQPIRLSLFFENASWVLIFIICYVFHRIWQCFNSLNLFPKYSSTSNFIYCAFRRFYKSPNQHFYL